MSKKLRSKTKRQTSKADREFKIAADKLLPGWEKSDGHESIRSESDKSLDKR